MKIGLREAVFFLLLMGIPVASWALVFHPQNLRNAEMLQQIEARQDRLRELNQATATIGDLKKEIAALEEAVQFFQSKLPNAKEMDKVLREVWQLAEQNQLTTKSIRTLPPSDKSMSAEMGLREQPIAMQLDGDFRGFYTFLQALENQPRIMRISRMTLEKAKAAPNGASEGQVQARFDMTIFFEKSKEEVCPPKTPM
ncbi:MAG: type 4a pilus biogenesis protein PilO [Phycisphaerae bacterium]|jgi:Tfp pilus assembly protein PilO